MNPELLIPEADALPLPGPVWLFKLLLHLTFVLHLLAMNFVLGGATIAAFERIRGRTRAESLRLAQWIEKRLPATMAFTVTLGVAPLLFVQALYGHLFYSSSVLMAWPWLFVVPIVIVVYYLAYTLSFRGDGASAGLKTASWAMLIGLVAVAFIYVNNMTLALRPETWAAKYFESARGMQWNLGDRTVIPRFLHMIVGAVAVAGFVIAWFGARRMSGANEDGTYMYGVGAMWFLVPTASQFLFGLWLLISLPREVMMTFMGGSPLGTALLALVILLPIAILVLQAIVYRAAQPLRATTVNAVLLLVTVVTMVLVRDMVRDAMLESSFTVSSLETQPQFGVFGIFAVLLVIGLIVTGWMVKAFLAAPRGAAPR